MEGASGRAERHEAPFAICGKREHGVDVLPLKLRDCGGPQSGELEGWATGTLWR